MKSAEEFTCPPVEELKSLENWANVDASILKCDRTAYYPPSHLADDDKETWLNEKNEADPQVERFRALNEHTPMPDMETAWISKVVGDTQQYNKPGSETPVSYAVNVVKSLRWPGAVTAAKGGRFVNIYVGWGLKEGDSPMTPFEPPQVEKDPAELEEQPEPTPLEEPKEEDPNEKGSNADEEEAE